MTDIPTDEMIEAIQEAAMAATQMYVSPKMVRAILEQAEAKRAADPALKECVEALTDARELFEGLRIDYPLSVTDCEATRAMLAKIDATLVAMTKGEE